MGKMIKLGMVFDESNAPDFGSIELSNSGEYTLLAADVGKLNSTLTRAVCVPLLASKGDFAVHSGANAIVADAPAVWRYHAQSDQWYEVIPEDE